MSIESIIIVLFYSAKPYWWLILILIAIPVISYFISLDIPFLREPILKITSIAIGITTGLLAPYITQSKLQYVATTTDWASLIGIMLGATIYSWITLKLLTREQ